MPSRRGRRVVDVEVSLSTLESSAAQAMQELVDFNQDSPTSIKMSARAKQLTRLANTKAAFLEMDRLYDAASELQTLGTCLMSLIVAASERNKENTVDSLFFVLHNLSVTDALPISDVIPRLVAFSCSLINPLILDTAWAMSGRANASQESSIPQKLWYLKQLSSPPSLASRMETHSLV
jgi:hypothetical protein